MPNPQPPLTVQTATLAAIEAEVARIFAYVNQCPVGGSAAAIGSWFSRLDEFAWRLEQFTPSAQWLYQQGLPAAAQRLEAVIRDFAGARRTYFEMYQNTVAIQSTWPAIWADVERFTIATISRATRYRQAVFDQWLQGYFDVTEERCFDCHRSIGIPGGGYCIDHARQRGLIR
jgi:hypothetical protein